MSNSDTTQRSPPLIPAQAGIQGHESGMWPWVPRYPGPHENRRPQQRSEDRLASAIFVGARRGDERMLRSSRPFHFPALSNHHSPNTFPLRGPLPRFSSLSSARPDEGVGGAPIRRIQRSRLRGASDHAYEACIAPIPNRCARLSALRLAVSAAGAALPWSPATATGPCFVPRYCYGTKP
jgi:hypothetical protein